MSDQEQDPTEEPLRYKQLVTRQKEAKAAVKKWSAAKKASMNHLVQDKDTQGEAGVK